MHTKREGGSSEVREMPTTRLNNLIQYVCVRYVELCVVLVACTLSSLISWLT